MRIRRAAQTRIPQIIKRTVRDLQMADETPDLRVVPVDDGMDAHEGRPAAVRRVEVLQALAVGVGAAGADEDGADAGFVGKVVGEGFLHGFGVAGEGEVVGVRAGQDEVVDLLEGVLGDDVDGSEGLGEGGHGGGVRWWWGVGCGGRGVEVREGGGLGEARVQGAEVEDE